MYRDFVPKNSISLPYKPFRTADPPYPDGTPPYPRSNSAAT